MAVVDAPEALETESAQNGRWTAAAVALTLVALLPVFVVVFTRTGRSYLPVQDIAVIDMRVRDVWTLDTPLVGAYSRLGWSHPGPLMYYLLAPLSLVTGGAAWATLVGAALLQGVATAWTARLAWVRGGLAMMVLWLGVLVLAYSATGPYLWLEAWNPHVAFPFLVLYLLQSWLVATGDDRRIVGAAFVASFLVQAHIGYLPLVGAAGAWALSRRRADLHFDGQRLRSLPVWRPTGIVLGVVWFAPLIENLVHWPGNVAYLAKAFVLGDGQGSHAGFGEATGLLSAPFRIMPPWLGGKELIDPFTRVAQPASPAWLLLPVALLGLAIRATRAPERRNGRRLIELALVTVVASWLALSRVSGDLNPYLFYWRLAVAPFAVLTALWVLIPGEALRRPPPLRNAAIALLGLAIVWGGTTTAVDLADHQRSVMRFEQPTGELLDQIEQTGRPTGPTLIRPAGTTLGGAYGGILDQLDREGAEVRVDRRRPNPVGYDRIAKPANVDAIWYVVEESHEMALLAALPGAGVVAEIHPLAGPEEAELTNLQLELARQLLAADETDLIDQLSSPYAALNLAGVPGVSAVDLDRLVELNRGSSQAGPCHCGVVTFSPEQAPCRRAARLHTPADRLTEVCRTSS